MSRAHGRLTRWPVIVEAIVSIECTEHHHAEYTLGGTKLVCHIDDAETLIDDLNAALEADDAARGAAQV